MCTSGGRDHDHHDKKMIIIITSHDDRHMYTKDGRDDDQVVI